MSEKRTDQSNVTHEMIHRGAAALVQGGVVRDPVGDVLRDYDWTPYEAAETVLRAVLDEGRWCPDAPGPQEG